MPESDLQKFDETVGRISRQQDFGLSSYAFLAGIVDNLARHAKFDNSYAGQALDLCITSVQTSLVLFCSRHWDESDNFQSIPAAKTHAERALDEIVGRHREFFVANGGMGDAERFYDYFKNLSQKVAELAESTTRTQIRVLRTEYYAHLVVNSRDRRQALRTDCLFDMDGLTVKSLLDFAEQTIKLGADFVYLQKRLLFAFDERVAYVSRYHDMFWDNLPVFSDVEGAL